jgi:potassium-dependent mechanosensitive channel
LSDFLRKCLLSVLVLCFAACGSVLAQSTSDALLSENEQRVDTIRTRFKAVQIVIGGEGVTDEQLDKQRGTIDALKLDIIAEDRKLSGPLAELQEQLARLGPPPAQGATEAEAMASQRRLLEARISRLAASQKQLELLRVEADQTVNRILVQQRDQFFDRIFRSDLSVLNPRLWFQTWTGGTLMINGLNEQRRRWWNEVGTGANPGGLLLFPAAVLIFYSLWNLLKRRLRTYFQRWGWSAGDGTSVQISSLKRLLQVFAGLVACGVFIFGAVVTIIATMSLSNLYNPRIDPLLVAFSNLLSWVVFNTVLTYLVCAPGRPEARLVSIREPAARTLPLLVFLLTLIYQLSRSLSEFSNVLNVPVNLTAGQTAIAAAAMIALLVLALIIMRREANLGSTEGQSYFLTWIVKAFPIIWVMLGVSAVALVVGYISLAYFIVGNILDTFIFGVVIALVHYFADAASDSMLNSASFLGSTLRATLGFSEKAISRISLLLRTITDIILALIAIPTLIGIWALNWIDIASFYQRFFSGFTIGNITISPTALLIAALVLAIGIALTRSLTGWLERRVLAETKLDKGVQDSVRTASSYVGYILAFAVALSAAGIDFSNIAIIAGALGVGIGFGLQSIVNNFVSGLILLAERPIRVGDWVETDKGDGIVKKINVRSTEIETFDSCTVFIPNSTLITQAVKNWTHRDTVGRLSVSVLVDFTNNTERVREVLLEIVRQHPKILRYPEPSVLLSKFAPTGYEFDVKGFVANVFEVPKTSSELRLSISKTFDEKKIKLAKA